MFVSQGVATVLVIALFAVAAGVFPALLFVTAPYGRFSSRGWGPLLPARWGWLLMESPSLLIPPLLFAAGGAWRSPYAIACLLVWEAHYVQRDLAYPFMIRSGKPMPLSVAAMGFIFNTANAYLNGWWIFRPAAADPSIARLTAPSFIAGLALFIAGFGLNLHSDKVLRELRPGGRGGYSIPGRGLHRLVASPNYLGELVEWTGWAILSANAAGWAFAAFTFANLVPRAIKNLAWYRETFGEAYPRARKAIIPFIL